MSVLTKFIPRIKVSLILDLAQAVDKFLLLAWKPKNFKNKSAPKNSFYVLNVKELLTGMQQRIRYKIGSIADTVLFVTAIEDFNKSLHYIVELGTLITGRYPLASHIVCSNSVKLSPLLSASTSLPIFTNLSNHILTNLATRQVLSKLLPRVMSYTSTGVHSLQFCTLHSSTSLGAAELL